MTFSITLASLNQLPNSSIAVCAHDAGAASHIAAWLAPLKPKLRLCLSGPAEKLFKEKLGVKINPIYTIEDALNGARLLISGTGWSSHLEHKSRVLARQRGIPSVAVLDHWVNYRERFSRDGEELLPDTLWVADDEAAALAGATFPHIPISQLPNHWLDEIRDTVHVLRTSRAHKHPRRSHRPAKRLLYLLEPIRIPWPSGNDDLKHESEAGEFQSLRYFLQKLPELIQLGWIAPKHELEGLSLRPHPSEAPRKYDGIIKEKLDDWPIQLDRSSNLSEALAWSDLVLGCETQALVAAMACNLLAVSVIPPWAPPCRLPQTSLHHLSKIVSP